MKLEFKLRLVNHLNFLEEELKDYSQFKYLTKKDYIADRDKRRSVERWIENIINSSIDISKVILILEDIRLPDNYKEIVYSLSTVKGLKAVDVKTLSSWVRFRNIVAHEYLDIRWDSIKKFIHETEPIYKNFLKKVRKYTREKISQE